MHKRWIQAIFLCHQLRQIFLLFHSADFGQSTGEALGSALSDAGSRGSAWLPRCSASRGEGISARPHRPEHRAPATPAVGLRGPAPTPARPFRRPSLAPSPPTHTSRLNWRGGNRTRPTPASHSLVGLPGEAGPTRRTRALIGSPRTSDRLTGRRQLQRGGERRRCKRFLLAAQAFPGC